MNTFEYGNMLKAHLDGDTAYMITPRVYCTFRCGYQGEKKKERQTLSFS